MAHQIEVLEVLRRLHEESERTIVMVLHDINQAARYSQHMIALVDGRIAHSGTPREMLTPRVLADVFGIEAEVLADSRNGAPFCIPLGLSNHHHL
jgi:iron complex transport system ATP-binding protein